MAALHRVRKSVQAVQKEEATAFSSLDKTMTSRQVRRDYWARLMAEKRREEAHLTEWRQVEAEAVAARPAEEMRAREAKEQRKAAVQAERERRLQEAEEEKRQDEAAFDETQERWEAVRQQAERAAAEAASPSSPTSMAAGSTPTPPPEAQAQASPNPAPAEASSGRLRPCWICQHPGVRDSHKCPNRMRHLRFCTFKGRGRGRP